MARQEDRHDAFLAKARAEVSSLADEGVVSSGNAFSGVLIVKAQESGVLLSGEDGTALRAALGALGYAPEDWAAVSTISDKGGPLASGLLRRAVVTLDPNTVVICDNAAAASMRDAFSEELCTLDDFDAAMLAPGVVVRVLGMRLPNLGGFEESLGDAREKQLRWHWLKQLRPLGEPF